MGKSTWWTSQVHSSTHLYHQMASFPLLFLTPLGSSLPLGPASLVTPQNLASADLKSLLPAASQLMFWSCPEHLVLP